MIIYRVGHTDAHGGTILNWARSKADVSKVKAKVRAEYRADSDQQNFGGFDPVRKHEIQPGKQGLVDWLNIYFSTDNG
jgi:hypothetical protein